MFVCIQILFELSCLSLQFMIVGAHVRLTRLIVLCFNFRARHGITNGSKMSLIKIYHPGKNHLIGNISWSLEKAGTLQKEEILILIKIANLFPGRLLLLISTNGTLIP